LATTLSCKIQLIYQQLWCIFQHSIDVKGGYGPTDSFFTMGVWKDISHFEGRIVCKELKDADQVFLCGD